MSDWTGLTIIDAARITQDRTRWRNVLLTANSPWRKAIDDDDDNNNAAAAAAARAHSRDVGRRMVVARSNRSRIVVVNGA